MRRQLAEQKQTQLPALIITVQLLRKVKQTLPVSLSTLSQAPFQHPTVEPRDYLLLDNGRLLVKTGQNSRLWCGIHVHAPGAERGGILLVGAKQGQRRH